MKQILIPAAILLCAWPAAPQGRPIDWPSYGGDAQRDGWEKSDSRITLENLRDFRLVLKMKLDKGSLTPPVVIGNLISYRGFKELAFVAGSSGGIWSIDADLERIFWKKRFEPTGSCASAQAAIPALTPPLNFGARPRPRPTAGSPAPATPRVGGTGFGVTRSVFMLSSDGKLHQLNSADGSDQYPPLQFVPPNAKASALTLHDGVVYTTTSAGCGAPDGVWAIDLNAANPEAVSFVSKTGGIGGIGGFALGADGTVYLQTANRMLALNPGDLKLKDQFTAPGSGSATPVVFPWKGHDVIASSGPGGSLYLLDSQTPGGADHNTPLFHTQPDAANRSVWGGLSTWEDADKTRWIAAPLWGPTGANGSIAVYKVEDQGGKPALKQAWVSREMPSPEPPVITSGVLFALAAGGPSGATLYALDSATGKEIYSTGSQVSAPANLNGISIANGRVYFTTTDGTLYAFGIFLER